MQYKGYRASVEYDDEDKIFFGSILGIRDIVGFHGTSVDELEQAFHESVDHYLEHCRIVGKQPDKEYSGKFVVRVDPKLHRKLAEEAESRHVSLNDLISQKLIDRMAS